MKTEQQKILIVDDQAENIQILSGILNEQYTLHFATTGAKAIAVAQEQLPDLILLDLFLPDINGYEVCNSLKSEEETSEIPVIFVTVSDDCDDEAKGLALGAIDYMTKPLNPAIVRARVKNHLDLKRYHDLLRNISEIDGLTCIPNRHKFDSVFLKEWRRGVRNKQPLSVIMLDIDCFKEYNDGLGHLAGDDCLKQVAQVLSQNLRRPADIVARYGGEEFVCILPGTDLDGACAVAKALQEGIAKQAIAHPSSPVSSHVSLSMGVATEIPSVEDGALKLLALADKMLYQAKEAGRNQFHVASR